MLHEFISAFFRQDDVVWRKADLAGVHGLARHDICSRQFEVGRFSDDDRRLATQFEGDRNQIFRCSFHDVFGNRRCAGEQQVIKR